MQIFVYDKSFEGLLAAVFDAFTLRTFPQELYGPDDVLPLTATGVHRVELSPEKPRRVFAALRKKLSPRALRGLFHAWLSELPGSDMALFRYICKSFRAERSIEGDMADPDVWEIVRLHRKVGKETERFRGFTRFQKSKDGVYFAGIAPKYNVIPLLTGHFADRLHDQPWILYDLARHYGVMFRPGAGAGPGSFDEVFLDEARRLEGGFLRPEYLAEGEMLLEELWRVYYASTAIKERVNPRLQRGFMPKRFWPYLTEKRPARPAGAPPEADLL